MMKRLKSISTNTAYTFIDQAIVSGVNFLLGILLANLLGLDQYGIFAFLWMIVFFVSSIHQAFMISPIYTLLPKQKAKVVYVSKLTGLQFVFSLAVFVGVYFVAKIITFYFPEYGFYLAELSMASVSSLYVLHDFFRRLFFGTKRPLLALVIDAIGYGFQPILMFFLYQFDALNLTNVFFGIALTMLLGILVVANFNQIKLSFAFADTIKLHWNFSKYLVGTSLLQWLSGNFFIAVSAGILGPMAVGVIRMSQNIVGVLHVLFLAFENTIPLKAAEILQNGGKAAMLQFIGQKIKQSLVLVAVLLGGIILMSKTIISQLYGSEYTEYQYVLFAFCLLYVFVFIGTFLRFIIRTLEHNKIIFISYVATTVFSLLLAKLMVQQLDIIGVLLGLIISQIITNGIYLIALKSEIKWIFK